MTIRVLNAAGKPFMGPSHAERLVRQGLAERISDHVIKMLAKPRAPIDSEELERRNKYDGAVGSGCLNQRQARGIPFAGDVGRMGLSA